MTSPSGSLGIGTSLPDTLVVDPEDGPAVFVDGGHAEFAVPREPGEEDVPVGRLDVLMLAVGQVVAADPR